VLLYSSIYFKQNNCDTPEQHSYLDMFKMLILGLFFTQITCSVDEEGRILFYYPTDRSVTPGFIRQMKADIARFRAKMDERISENAAKEHTQQTLEAQFGAALASRLAEMHEESLINDSCRKYELEINDPCVAVVYDERRDMCKVTYACKVVDLGDGQKSVAPIGEKEAHERHFKTFDTKEDSAAGASAGVKINKAAAI